MSTTALRIGPRSPGYPLPCSNHQETLPPPPTGPGLLQKARHRGSGKCHRAGSRSGDRFPHIPLVQLLMSAARCRASGQAQVYLGEWRVIWGAGRHRYSQPPFGRGWFSHQLTPGRAQSTGMSIESNGGALQRQTAGFCRRSQRGGRESRSRHTPGRPDERLPYLPAAVGCDTGRDLPGKTSLPPPG